MILGPQDPTERSWVGHITENPNLRIRLGGRIYERVASRVSDLREHDRARDALEKKYGLDPAERDAAREVWIFRLDARR